MADIVLEQGSYAQMAVAGVNIQTQTTVTATAGANVTYTITKPGTRRLMCLHLGTGAGDIRVNYNAAATSASMPLLPQRYFVVEAAKDSYVAFWNTTAGDITVNVLEMA